MNYIVLDLEWNTAYSKKSKRFVNEIIEIGAVKLDEKLNKLGSVSIMVKSKLTKKLCARFKDLTSITNEEMASGMDFENAMSEYVKWAGSDTLTLTWSTSDLYALIDNCSLFCGDEHIPCITRYADLQAFAQDDLRKRGFEVTSQISLSKAAEMFEIDTSDTELHRAKNDCDISAEIFKIIFSKSKLRDYTKDTTDEEFYKRLLFKPFYINDIKNENVSFEGIKFKCPECRKATKLVSDWRANSNNFTALFKCRRCGTVFTGRVAFKQYYDRVTKKLSVSRPKDDKDSHKFADKSTQGAIV